MSPPDVPDRATLRSQLLAARRDWAASGALERTQPALGHHLADVVTALEPQVLGVYWPVRSEFNAVVALRADFNLTMPPLALPWARRSPPSMQYHRWDGLGEPEQRDECGIPAPAAPPSAVAVPDVVLVPCVGYTPQGLRLGYGGGYFDRWLAAHPHVTAVGVAWSGSCVDMRAEPHDQLLTLIVTEAGIVTPE